MMAVQTRMTASEYMELPETSQPMMLIDGEIIVSPSPTPEHQDSVGEIFFFLKRLKPIGKFYIAPLDVRFDASNVMQPDVLWIAPDGRCQIDPITKQLTGAPDFIAEVASPGTVRTERKKKFVLYEKYGVREYWLVDPEAQLIEVWSLQDGHFVRVGLFGAGEGFTSPLFGAIAGDAIFAEAGE